MRCIITLMAVLSCAPLYAGAGEPPPQVEKYLHSGELALGDSDLQRALNAAPEDDQIRFGLGMLRFVRAIERLGQSLYEHGVKSESAHVPFLRMPVPQNPDPTPITYPIIRRIFEQFTDDLAKAEATLARVKDDNVALRLHLADVRLDFVGDGKTRATLIKVLKKLTRQQQFDFLKDNPRFLVRFDRGDVAWLRSYCHLLSAMADLYLAMDGTIMFDWNATLHWAKPKGNPAQKPDHPDNSATFIIRIVEPSRLHSFRMHMLRVCDLNRETWRHIRAERDNDHEWLPHARQIAVLGLPVRDEMINGWLRAVDELEGLLKGEKLLSLGGDKAINVRVFLDDPPAKLDIHKIFRNEIDAKYLEKETDKNRFDFQVLFQVWQLFENNLGTGYMAWFN